MDPTLLARASYRRTKSVPQHSDKLSRYSCFASPVHSRSLQETPRTLLIDDVSPQIVRLFLAHLESVRSCSVATRNQRLAAIHSLARFIGLQSPEHLGWSAEVRAIPFKKTAEPVVGYLDKAEMDAMLQLINRRTVLGNRNYALLLFLYNTGARADEAAHVHVVDLALGKSPSVRITGKGSKVRVCPLWPHTAEILKPLVTGRVDGDYLFRNMRGTPLTRFGIYRLVQDAAIRASPSIPTLRTKRISPHIIRHYLPFLTMSCNSATNAFFPSKS